MQRDDEQMESGRALAPGDMSQPHAEFVQQAAGGLFFLDGEEIGEVGTYLGVVAKGFEIVGFE